MFRPYGATDRSWAGLVLLRRRIVSLPSLIQLLDHVERIVGEPNIYGSVNFLYEEEKKQRQE